MSDFSLMDAIECGIVKLPRVPVSDNITSDQMPMYRELWKHIGKKMPKKGSGCANALVDARALPVELQTAMEALYGHYEKTSEIWDPIQYRSPPVLYYRLQQYCVIKAGSMILCRATQGQMLMGMRSQYQAGSNFFRNYDEHGNPLSRPRTLLVDSAQLESGEGLDQTFFKSSFR